MSEQRNLIFAVGLSVGIFFAWDHFFGVKPVATPQTAVVAPKTQEAAPKTEVLEKPQMIVENRPDAIQAQKRIQIENAHVTGSINLKGCHFDDITLKDYKVEVKEDAAFVDLLNPKNTKDFYYVDFDVLADDQVQRPDADTVWKVAGSSNKIEVGKPVTVFYENAQKIRFERTFSIDENFMLTSQQKVVNNSNLAIHIQHKANIKRHKPNLDGSTYILHEGAVGYLDNHLKEESYDKLQEKTLEEIASTGGWLGFSDKYWLVALIANPQTDATFSMQSLNGQEFITSIKLSKKVIQPGESVEQTLQVYVGPKKLSVLDQYEETQKIKKFDLAIDFGWFYFLTKPLFQFLDWLYQLVGNFGIAIIIMTLLSKIILFPLANKSYYSMAKMRTLGPKLEAIKAKYEKDPVKLQQEMMNLYRKEKINPVSGCLPMIIQAPIFFCLYKVLYISIEMRHAPFYGWIQDLSAKDPTSLFNLFGLLPFDPPSFLIIGIWPLLMGATMVLQQRLSPQPTDPTQAKMMLFMPIFFTYLFGSFPAGLVIYWTVSNVLSIIQQYAITKMAENK
ncbi:MAG: Membrane protein insertase YidC [Holosporales bacterium]